MGKRIFSGLRVTKLPLILLPIFPTASACIPFIYAQKEGHKPENHPSRSSENKKKRSAAVKKKTKKERKTKSTSLTYLLEGLLRSGMNNLLQATFFRLILLRAYYGLHKSYNLNLSILFGFAAALLFFMPPFITQVAVTLSFQPQRITLSFFRWLLFSQINLAIGSLLSVAIHYLLVGKTYPVLPTALAFLFLTPLTYYLFWSKKPIAKIATSPPLPSTSHPLLPAPALAPSSSYNIGSALIATALLNTLFFFTWLFLLQEFFMEFGGAAVDSSPSSPAPPWVIKSSLFIFLYFFLSRYNLLILSTTNQWKPFTFWSLLILSELSFWFPVVVIPFVPFASERLFLVLVLLSHILFTYLFTKFYSKEQKMTNPVPLPPSADNSPLFFSPTPTPTLPRKKK